MAEGRGALLSKPFKVINCLSQGFAVAVLASGHHTEPLAGVDLEMVVWGMSLDKAVAMAAELNNEPELPAGVLADRGPQHVRD